MPVYDLNEHRRAARQRKADALRYAIKDQAGDIAGTPAGLRLLASAAWAGRDRAELWANLAVLAYVNPPGSSSGESWRTIRLIVEGLRADADDLELEHADQAS